MTKPCRNTTNDKMDMSMLNKHISYEDMINITIQKQKKKMFFFKKNISLHYDHMVIQEVDVYLWSYILDNRM